MLLASNTVLARRVGALRCAALRIACRLPPALAGPPPRAAGGGLRGANVTLFPVFQRALFPLPRRRRLSGGAPQMAWPDAAGRVALVKVLDKWPLRSGGLQREQVISVGSCAPLERNQRYIFFLEPTEQPLVFKTAFAPLDTNGKNLKKEVGKILCTDCGLLMKWSNLLLLNAVSSALTSDWLDVLTASLIFTMLGAAQECR
ncbi:Pro-neuregulin-2, membrane-bound isoform [Tupaia chinensis]|uniref:Pro-neuregulin-2, membrane-bound isoform n=1 Tax=Tupaia chinensis TaxID=246437 RepID=L9JU63_TUPCH|nr:Pro-neuregulin-2, membrane-bound isoform [Tupaia chinensis]